MKLIILTLFIVSAINGAPTSKAVDLFTDAWRVQHLLSPKQADIDSDVTELRESLTNVLEVRSNSALQGIEKNVVSIFEIEEPFKVQIDALASSSCKDNLLRQLNTKTEFTGFSSSLCVRTYDRKSEGIITNAQEFIAIYEGLFVRLQKVVVQSFAGHNALIQEADIVEQFVGEYQARLDEWEGIRPQAEDFEFNLDTSITAEEAELNSCMETVRNEASVQYQQLATMIPICQEFI